MLITRKHGHFLGYCATIVGVSVLGAAVKAVPLPSEVFLLGVLIIAVSLLPLFGWIRSGSRSVPMFALICLSCGLQYGFAVFSQPNTLVIQNQLTEIPWEYIRKAQGLALIGISMMIFGYWAGGKLLQRSPTPPIDLPLRRQQRLRLVFACLLLWGLGLALQRAGSGWLGGINRLLASLPLLALAVLTIAICKRNENDAVFWEKFLAWGLVIWLTYVGLGTAMLETVFLPIAIFVMIRMAKLRRISIIALVCGFVLMSVLNGVKLTVRYEVRMQDTGGAAKTSVWANALKNADYSLVLRDSHATDTPAFWRTLLDRFGLLNRFGWVCMNTPERVPYFKGETYKYFLYAPVPRFAWPTKPEATESTAVLDYAYLLRDFTEGFTYVIGIGYIPEAYANFSWLGVFVVLSVQGLSFAFFNKWLNGEQSEGGAAIYVLVTAGFINGIGATAIMLFGNLLQIVVCCVALVYVFSRRLRNRPAGPPPHLQASPAPPFSLLRDVAREPTR